MNSRPKRAHPEAPSADNGELVAMTDEDVESSRREADAHEHESNPADDAFGMRAEPSPHK